MHGSPPQVPLVTGGDHLVLYDGVCGLCNRLLHFLLSTIAAVCSRSLRSKVQRSRDGQAVRRRPGRTLMSFCVVADYHTNRAQLFSRSRAALFVAGELGWPWRRRSCPGFADRDPGPRVRRRRQKPLSRVRPSRTMPDSAAGGQRPLHRVKRPSPGLNERRTTFRTAERLPQF